MSKPCRINGRTSFPMAQATIPSRRRQHWAYSPATVGLGFHWGPLDIHLEQAVICEYIYIYGPVLRLSTPPSPPHGLGPQVAAQFPSICKLLAAFLRSSFVFARSLQHFWLPASHLLGTCYLLGDLRSTHTPSKYLRATYSHIYMCYVSTVSTSYLLLVYSDNTTCI